MKVAVLGLGYVGTVTAAGLASQGHTVVGVDVDPMKVEAIREARSPVVEPGLDALIEGAVSSGMLHATVDVAEAMDEADVSLICVGTPSMEGGGTDLTYLSRAVAGLHGAMTSATPPTSGHHSVVVRSTVPPGTCASVVAPALLGGDASDGWAIGIAMCPEFLREGSSVDDFYSPPFVVVGTSDTRTARTVGELFAFCKVDHHTVEIETAEALKYACNAFHAVKVTFANEMGRVFAPFGVDSRRVMEIFCQDTKLNIAPTYLRPGFAFGGSCLPKDLRALQRMARVTGVDVPLLGATTTSNEIAVRSLVDRVLATGHRSVCMLGLSFKADTDDLRESPYLEVAERFVGKGLDVRIYDPIVNPERLVGANRRFFESTLAHINRLLTSSPQDALTGAEVVLVASAEARGLEALQQATPQLIIDVNGRLSEQIERSEAYQGVAW